MMYQLALKRRSQSGMWFSRPFFSTYIFADVRAQHAEALANTPDIVEAVVLLGHTYNDISEQYDRFLAGRPYDGLDPSEDGVRAYIEHAPLRKSYEVPESKLSHFDLFIPNEIHGYTALMRRVLDGTLGGPNDGE